MSEAMEVAEEDRVDLGKEEPNHIHVAHCEDSEIQEMQMYDTYNGRDGIRTSMAEEGVGGSREKNVGVGRGMNPPVGKQARRRDDDSTLEYDRNKWRRRWREPKQERKRRARQCGQSSRLQWRTCVHLCLEEATVV